MNKRPNWRERAQYFMDELFSRGPGAMIAALAIFSILIIVVAALFLSLTGIAPDDGEGLSFFEAFWVSMMRTLDAGTMGGDNGWGFRLVEFVVTVGGVFVISTLIGILSNGISERLETLRKGRSRVLEQNHVVILGWSQQVFTIISELVEANRSQASSCIVLLGNREKPEMEDEIRQRVPDLGKTKLVVRSGSPIEMSDLELVNLNTARTIIVPSPESDDPDAEVIKTILAITNRPNRRAGGDKIVAELRDAKNFEIGRVVGKDEVEFVLVGNIIARVIAQTCRQNGLSVVYTELLNFGGDEIYFHPTGPLAGKTFGDSLTRFEKNAVLGVYSAGQPRLNPPMDTPLKAEDELIMLMEDEDRFAPLPDGQATFIDEHSFSQKAPTQALPEHTLVLGWNWRALTVLSELDNYVAPASKVTVLAELDEEEARSGLALRIGELHNQELLYVQGDITDRRMLESLPLDKIDHVIILAYSDALDTQQADARTMVCLLHIRDLAEKRGYKFSIVTEMLDIRNRNLAEVAHADDFIVSDSLISLMLAQVSENRALNAVFADLFDPEGSEVYLKYAKDYVQLGQPVNFYTVTEAARRRGEVAIGYRLHAFKHDASKAYGVVTNPAKSEKVTFAERDRIIVIAEQ